MLAAISDKQVAEHSKEDRINCMLQNLQPELPPAYLVPVFVILRAEGKSEKAGGLQVVGRKLQVEAHPYYVGCYHQHSAFICEVDDEAPSIILKQRPDQDHHCHRRIEKID